MNKSVSSLFLSLLLVGIFVAWFRIQPSVHAQGETFVSIVNAVDGTSDFNFTSATPLGTVFTANITVADVTFFAGWQLNLTYDATLLNITGENQLVMPSDNVFFEYADKLRVVMAPGMVFWGAVIILGAPFEYVNVTGTQTLCQINFTIIKNDTAASTQLHLVEIGEYPIDTLLINPNADRIPFTPRHGHYYLSAAGETFVSIVNAVDGTSDFNFTSATPLGTVFTANITVTNIRFLAAWQINITYDPTLLNVTANDQLLMPTDNVFGQYANVFNIRRNPGMVFWGAGISFSGPIYVNITGTGTLCQINFTIIKNNVTASAQLHLVVAGEYVIFTEFVRPNAEDILYTPRDGHYYIRLVTSTVTCVGDINLDYITDGKDFVLVKRAMGSTPGSPRWNPGADLNADGSVGVQDYQIVKNHIPSVFP